MHDENTDEINGVKMYLKKLTVTGKTLTEIRNDFQERGGGKLDGRKLHALLASKYKIVLSDDDFKPLFAKMDIFKEGVVTFLQFVTYLETESELQRKQNNQNAWLPLKLMPKLSPVVSIEDDKNAKHRLKLIAFNPLTGHSDYGEYITVSEIGEILKFTPELKWKNTYGLNEKVIIPVVTM